MNVLKKSLLVSTALFWCLRDTWAMQTPLEEGKYIQAARSVASQAIRDEESVGEDKQVLLEERQNIPLQQITGNAKQFAAYPFFSSEYKDYIRLLNVRYLIENQDKFHPI